MDKNTLLSYQPNYYSNSKVMEQANIAHSKELTLLNDKIALVKNNYYIDTADSNTLSRWEKILSLKVSPSDDIYYRRRRINSRLNGLGNFSVKMIKEIANYYSNGDIEAIFDIPHFTILINFISSSGIPYSLEYFEEMIDELKPAFFRVDYKMTSKTKDTLNIRAFTLCGEEIRVFPYQITTVESSGKVKFALGQTQSAETITVQPKGGI